MTASRRRFSQEFKDELCQELISTSNPIRVVAEAYGVGPETLRNQLIKHRNANGGTDEDQRFKTFRRHFTAPTRHPLIGPTHLAGQRQYECWHLPRSSTRCQAAFCRSKVGPQRLRCLHPARRTQAWPTVMGRGDLFSWLSPQSSSPLGQSQNPLPSSQMVSNGAMRFSGFERTEPRKHLLLLG
jgi:hypothetical protein